MKREEAEKNFEGAESLIRFLMNNDGTENDMIEEMQEVYRGIKESQEGIFKLVEEDNAKWIDRLEKVKNPLTRYLIECYIKRNYALMVDAEKAIEDIDKQIEEYEKMK